MKRQKSLITRVCALVMSAVILSGGVATASQAGNAPTFIDLEAFSSNEVAVTVGDQVTILVTAIYDGGAGDAIPCGQLNLGVVNDEDANFRDDAEAPGVWEQHGWRSSNRVAATNCIGSANVGTRVYWAVNLFVPQETSTGSHAVGMFSPLYEGVGWSESQIALSVNVTDGAEAVTDAQPDTNGPPVVSGLTAIPSDSASVTAGERAALVVSATYDGGKGPIPCEQLNLGVVGDADASFRDDADPAGGWLSANRVAPQDCDGEVVQGDPVQWLVPIYVSAETEPGTYMVGNFSPVYDGVDNGWAAGQISLFVAVTAPATTADVAASPAATVTDTVFRAASPEASIPVEPGQEEPTVDVVVDATTTPPAEGTVAPEPTLVETLEVATETTTTMETPEVATETITTIETPAVGGEVLPPEFVGTWEGTAAQQNPAGEFPLTITFTGGGLDETVATIDYPEDDCGGELRLDRVDLGSIQLEERVFVPGPNCVDGGAVTLTLNSDGTMDYSWIIADGATSAGATLERTSGPGDVPAEPVGEATATAPTEPDPATSTVEPTEPVPPVETAIIEPIETEASEGSGDSLPAEYAGTWEGIAVQDDPPDEFPLTLTFTGSTIGEVVAMIEYPSYDCTGELTLDRVEIDRGRIVLLEDITVGEGVCADGGSLALYAETDGTLSFLWNSATGPTTASATLSNTDGVVQTAEEPTADSSTGADDVPGIEAPEPEIDDSQEDVPEEENTGVPSALENLLPSASDLPAGFSVATDEVRTQEELSTLFGPSPDETSALLDEWGWLANAYREFENDSATADPSATTSLDVSAHEFAAATGASEALTFFVDDAASTFGLAEIPVGEDAGQDLIGDEVRALAGPIAGENAVILYVRTDAFMVRVSGTSASGDPLGDVGTLARILLGESVAFPEAIEGDDGPDVTADPTTEQTELPDDEFPTIESNDGIEPEPPADPSEDSPDPVIEQPEEETPEPITPDPTAEDGE